MAALMAALGFTSASAKSTTEPEAPVETKCPFPTKVASTSSLPTGYFNKLAADIVANSPSFGKARVPIIASHRDKESLVCEIIDLKKALEYVELHLHMHKQHYLKCLEESRRLERDVEELELRGNFDAPRTGGVVRLESRFKGLGAQVHLLQKILADRKYGELAQLRRDLGATHTREIEVERDIVATEVSRLKIYLQRMRVLQQNAQEENENLLFCKRQVARLVVANPQVLRLVGAHKAMAESIKDDIAQLKREGEEAIEKMKALGKKEKIFGEKLDNLEPKALAAEHEKKKAARQDDQLGYNKMVFNQEFRKEHPGILLA